jgi:DNA-binding FadR family transcriptional regulator
MTNATKEKKASQVTLTLNRLVSSITSGHYKGMLPPQDKLATELHVSRTVLREALAMMLLRNMIDVRPKIGTKINRPDQWLVLVPQSYIQTDQEICETLDMFMSLYRVKGWEDDLAYKRAAAILQTRSKVIAGLDNE